jgi:acetylornithine deacetylase/succinyl-diaminopimelate desuccinylase-like protein
MLRKLRAHIEKQGFHLVDGEPDAETRARYPRLASLTVSGPSMRAFRTASTDPQARALVSAIAAAYGAQPVQLRMLGGTVPISPFIEALGFPAVVVPLVNFDNNQHEENENLRLGAFFDGIVTVAAVLTM